MIKIGIIGIGKWGINHLNSLRRIECELIGVSDIDPKKKALVGDDIKFFTDYNDLLKEVDAVTVATPTDTHYEIAKNCLETGKHVLLEKPTTVKSGQTKELVKIAWDKGLVLSVGYLYRFNNSIKRLRELIRDVGEIQYITCRYTHSTKPPRKDSGVILNLVIHPVDILNFITDKRPHRVYAKKKNLLSGQFEDSAMIMLDYGEFFASIEVSCCHPEKKRDIWVIAEKEKIYVDYFRQKITRYPFEVSYEKIEKKAPKIEEVILPNESLKDELEYFLRLIDTENDREVVDALNIGREEYYTTRICELGIESAETGKEMVV